MDPAYNRFFTITKSDTVNLTEEEQRMMRALYVGGAGNIVAVMPDGTKKTFTGLLAGTVYPIVVKRIDSTDTTASALLGLAQI